jgi:hypothetical protein
MPSSGPFLSGISAIKSYTIGQLANRTALWDAAIHNAPVLYVFNSASTATADDNLILMPSGSPAAGRWEKVVVASGGGGGGVTVDSVVATSITMTPTGPIFPSIKPSVTPTAIGETRFVYRRYTGDALFNGFQLIGLTLTRSAYFTAVDLTPGGWVSDRSGVIDIEYLTLNGNPIGSDPSLNETSELRVEPDYAGQRIVHRGATAFGNFHIGSNQARIIDFTSALPVAGSTTQWWQWGSWF